MSRKQKINVAGQGQPKHFKNILRIVQCLSVTPTNPIHTGVQPTRQLHREIEPRPLQTQRQKDKKTKTNRKRLSDNRTTDKHCCSATAKRHPTKGNLSTDSPYKNRFATKMQPKHTKNKTVQNQHRKGTNDRTRTNGKDTRTGTTSQTKQITGTNGGRGQNGGRKRRGKTMKTNKTRRR